MKGGFFYMLSTHTDCRGVVGGMWSAHDIGHIMFEVGIDRVLVYPRTPAPGQVTVLVDPEYQGRAIGAMEETLPIGAQVIVQSFEYDKVYELANNEFVKIVSPKVPDGTE